MLLLPKKRKVFEGSTIRFSAQYSELDYNCTFYVSTEEKLIINVQIPQNFKEAAVNPTTFSNFEELLLSYNKISSLELFLKQLKSINFESVFPKIKLTLLKMVNGSYVLYREIKEKNGKRLEHVQPTDYGIIVVNRDESWECYDEERNFQVFCNVGSNVEIICEPNLYNSVLSKVDCFRMIAKIIYKQNF